MFVPVYTYCSSDRNIYLNQNSNASSKTKTFAFYKKLLRMNGVDALCSLYTAALNKLNYYTVMKNRQAKKSPRDRHNCLKMFVFGAFLVLIFRHLN